MDDDALAFLRVDPAALERAPERPTRADSWPRIDIYSADRRRCSSCRALAVATRVVRPAGYGPRWHDRCRACMIAGIRLTWEAGTPTEGRYEVTLLLEERPATEGWWQERATAERKYLAWIGEYGSRAGAGSPSPTRTAATSWRAGPTANDRPSVEEDAGAAARSA
ncbi:hypothetical protein [Streptomyces sp. NPDC058291]|uniref:hypothetical protein n=1 Tax=Streptomyces sp. NPDC058291 TaxID=3346427 RepID=UPI0036EB09D7